MLAFACMVAACGGGGSGDNAPPQPPAVTVTTSVDTGLTISPVTASVATGGQVTFTITPKAEYVIHSATGCGGTLSGNSYVTAALAADCTVTVTSRHFAAAFGVIRLRPNALFHDEFASTPVTLEIMTAAPESARLSAEFFAGWFDNALGNAITRVPLYDDGTHGDRVAGDGIHTAIFTTGMIPRLRYHDNTVDFLPLSIVTRDAAGNATAPAIQGFPQVRLGVVHRSLSVATTSLAADVIAAPNAVNIVMRNSFNGSADGMKRLYDFYPDSFDGFAIHYVGATQAQALAGGGAVKSSVQGLNQAIFDNASAYGSAGALTAGVHMFVDIAGEYFGHEFGHTWAFFLSQPGLELTGGTLQHAALSTAPGLMAQDRNGMLRELPGGDFEVAYPDVSALMANRKYSDLELYLMGLMPSQAVAPAYYARTPSPTSGVPVPRDRLTRATIDDVIRVYGQRVPAVEQSPKSFRMAFIVLSEVAATPAELALVNRVAEYYASDSDGGVADMRGLGIVLPPRSFKSATWGLGTLITRLPSPK